MKRNCKEEGHDLKEIMTCVGFECKSCDYEILSRNMSKHHFGRCPKCEAPKDKIEPHYHGYEHLKYECTNCGHSWVELM